MFTSMRIYHILFYVALLLFMPYNPAFGGTTCTDKFTPTNIYSDQGVYWLGWDGESFCETAATINEQVCPPGSWVTKIHLSTNSASNCDCISYYDMVCSDPDQTHLIRNAASTLPSFTRDITVSDALTLTKIQTWYSSGGGPGVSIIAESTALYVDNIENIGGTGGTSHSPWCIGPGRVVGAQATTGNFIFGAIRWACTLDTTFDDAAAIAAVNAAANPPILYPSGSSKDIQNQTTHSLKVFGSALSNFTNMLSGILPGSMPSPSDPQLAFTFKLVFSQYQTASSAIATFWTSPNSVHQGIAIREMTSLVNLISTTGIAADYLQSDYPLNEILALPQQLAQLCVTTDGSLFIGPSFIFGDLTSTSSSDCTSSSSLNILAVDQTCTFTCPKGTYVPNKSFQPNLTCSFDSTSNHAALTINSCLVCPFFIPSTNTGPLPLGIEACGACSPPFLQFNNVVPNGAVNSCAGPFPPLGFCSISCDAGYYVSGGSLNTCRTDTTWSAAQSCVACPTGTTSLGGSGDISSCSLCSLDLTSTDFTTASAHGITDCPTALLQTDGCGVTCDAGYYSTNYAAVALLKDPTSTPLQLPSNTIYSCTSSSTGSPQLNGPYAACVQCPPGYWSLPGATSQQDCNQCGVNQPGVEDQDILNRTCDLRMLPTSACGAGDRTITFLTCTQYTFLPGTSCWSKVSSSLGNSYEEWKCPPIVAGEVFSPIPVINQVITQANFEASSIGWYCSFGQQGCLAYSPIIILDQEHLYRVAQFWSQSLSIENMPSNMPWPTFREGSEEAYFYNSKFNQSVTTGSIGSFYEIVASLAMPLQQYESRAISVLLSQLHHRASAHYFVKTVLFNFFMDLLQRRVDLTVMVFNLALACRLQGFQIAVIKELNLISDAISAIVDSLTPTLSITSIVLAVATVVLAALGDPELGLALGTISEGDAAPAVLRLFGALTSSLSTGIIDTNRAFYGSSPQFGVDSSIAILQSATTTLSSPTAAAASISASIEIAMLQLPQAIDSLASLVDQHEGFSRLFGSMTNFPTNTLASMDAVTWQRLLVLGIIHTNWKMTVGWFYQDQVECWENFSETDWPKPYPKKWTSLWYYALSIEPISGDGVAWNDPSLQPFRDYARNILADTEFDWLWDLTPIGDGSTVKAQKCDSLANCESLRWFNIDEDKVELSLYASQDPVLGGPDIYGWCAHKGPTFYSQDSWHTGTFESNLNRPYHYLLNSFFISVYHPVDFKTGSNPSASDNFKNAYLDPKNGFDGSWIPIGSFGDWTVLEPSFNKLQLEGFWSSAFLPTSASNLVPGTANQLSRLFQSGFSFSSDPGTDPGTGVTPTTRHLMQVPTITFRPIPIPPSPTPLTFNVSEFSLQVSTHLQDALALQPWQVTVTSIAANLDGTPNSVQFLIAGNTSDSWNSLMEVVQTFGHQWSNLSSNLFQGSIGHMINSSISPTASITVLPTPITKDVPLDSIIPTPTNIDQSVFSPPLLHVIQEQIIAAVSSVAPTTSLTLDNSTVIVNETIISPCGFATSTYPFGKTLPDPGAGTLSSNQESGMYINEMGELSSLIGYPIDSAISGINSNEPILFSIVISPPPTSMLHQYFLPSTPIPELDIFTFSNPGKFNDMLESYSQWLGVWGETEHQRDDLQFGRLIKKSITYSPKLTGINLSTSSSFPSIPLGFPVSITVSSDFLYVSDLLTRRIIRLLTSTSQIDPSFRVHFPHAFSITLSHDEQFLYVLDGQLSSLYRIQLNNNSSYLPDPCFNVYIASPIDMAISPEDRYIYVASNGVNPTIVRISILDSLIDSTFHLTLPARATSLSITSILSNGLNLSPLDYLLYVALETGVTIPYHIFVNDVITDSRFPAWNITLHNVTICTHSSIDSIQLSVNEFTDTIPFDSNTNGTLLGGDQVLLYGVCWTDGTVWQLPVQGPNLQTTTHLFGTECNQTVSPNPIIDIGSTTGGSSTASTSSSTADSSTGSAPFSSTGSSVSSSSSSSSTGRSGSSGTGHISSSIDGSHTGASSSNDSSLASSSSTLAPSSSSSTGGSHGSSSSTSTGRSSSTGGYGSSTGNSSSSTGSVVSSPTTYPTNCCRYKTGTTYLTIPISTLNSSRSTDTIINIGHPIAKNSGSDTISCSGNSFSYWDVPSQQWKLTYQSVDIFSTWGTSLIYHPSAMTPTLMNIFTSGALVELTISCAQVSNGRGDPPAIQGCLQFIVGPLSSTTIQSHLITNSACPTTSSDDGHGRRLLSTTYESESISDCPTCPNGNLPWWCLDGDRDDQAHLLPCQFEFDSYDGWSEKEFQAGLLKQFALKTGQDQGRFNVFSCNTTVALHQKSHHGRRLFSNGISGSNSDLVNITTVVVVVAIFPIPFDSTNVFSTLPVNTLVQLIQSIPSDELLATVLPTSISATSTINFNSSVTSYPLTLCSNGSYALVCDSTTSPITTTTPSTENTLTSANNNNPSSLSTGALVGLMFGVGILSSFLTAVAIQYLTHLQSKKRAPIDSSEPAAVSIKLASSTILPPAVSQSELCIETINSPSPTHSADGIAVSADRDSSVSPMSASNSTSPRAEYASILNQPTYRVRVHPFQSAAASPPVTE